MTNEILAELDGVMPEAAVRAALGGAGSSTLRRWVREGKFPAPVALSARRIAWRRRDVAAWLDARPTVGGNP